jgi:hypothetical protein
MPARVLQEASGLSRWHGGVRDGPSLGPRADELGHTVRLIPPSYAQGVRQAVQERCGDAAAICEGLEDSVAKSLLRYVLGLTVFSFRRDSVASGAIDSCETSNLPSPPVALNALLPGRAEVRGRMMPYCIGFEIMNLRKLVTAEATTARQAVLLIDQVQTCDQELKFIRSPQEGEIGVEMLRLLAKEENEELGQPVVRSSHRLRR